MDKRIFLLGSVLALTACSGVELAETGTVADSKVPISIEGYNFITPAMASGGFCKGVPAIESYDGIDGESGLYEVSLMYLKEGFTLPTFPEPSECAWGVRFGHGYPGLVRLSVRPYVNGKPPETDEYKDKCEDNPIFAEEQRWCVFFGDESSFSTTTSPIGSLDSQQEELRKFTEMFEKNVKLNLPNEVYKAHQL